MLLAYGRRVLVKLFRRTAEGGTPDLDVVRHLTGPGGFPNTPEILGELRYERPGADPLVLALARRFVDSESTAWQLCATALDLHLHRMAPGEEPAPAPLSLLSGLAWPPDDEAEASAPPGDPAEAAIELIGRRAAQMHLALAQDRGDPAFAPEPFDKGYRRSVYQDISSHSRRILDILALARPGLPQAESLLAGQLLDLREELAARLLRFRDSSVRGRKIRVHGEWTCGTCFSPVATYDRGLRGPHHALALRPQAQALAPARRMRPAVLPFAVTESVLNRQVQARPQDATRLRAWADEWCGRMARCLLRATWERPMERTSCQKTGPGGSSCSQPPARPGALRTGRSPGTAPKTGLGGLLHIGIRLLTTPPAPTRRPHETLDTACALPRIPRLPERARKLLMLDYDGTLAPFSVERHKAAPYVGVRSHLETLCRASDWRVVIVSVGWPPSVLLARAAQGSGSLRQSRAERLDPGGTISRAPLPPAWERAWPMPASAEGQAVTQQLEEKHGCLALHVRA